MKPSSAMPPPVYTSHQVGGEEKAMPPTTKPITMIVTAIHDTGRPWNDSCASAAAWPRGDSSGAGPIDSGATALLGGSDTVPHPGCSVVICDPLVPPFRCRPGTAWDTYYGETTFRGLSWPPGMTITSRPRLPARARFRAVTRLP